jgi:heat shock protein HtpX
MYSAISANKRRSWLLLIGFSIFATTLILLFGVYFLELDIVSSAILGFCFSTIYALISYYASASIALSSQGAREVKKSEAFELVAMVENLSITAGIPTPKVYIIDDEAPNAFATGRDPKNAAIAVTTGLLKRLNKVELEGVLAHEISHVKNYDIRVMTLVVVLVGLIVLISDIALRSTLFGGRSSNDRSGGGVLILIGIALGILAPIFAQFIKLAVSRTREYLADASGSMLTRHPEGLAAALEKIAAHPRPMKRANHATAHLYISSPFKADSNKKKANLLERLMSTHPPIEDRIAKLRGML